MEGEERSQTLTPLEERVDELRARIGARDPHETARRSGTQIVAATDERVTLELPLWDAVYHISWPGIRPVEVRSGEPGRASVEAAILYYLGTADGTPVAGEWISFQELPGGTFYHRAFQGYSGEELVRHFGEDVEAYREAAARAGGAPFPWSDGGFTFLPLPRVPLAVVYWLGEEGIPTKAQVLFDRASHHYMPTDALAGLGAELVHRIMRAHRAV